MVIGRLAFAKRVRRTQSPSRKKAVTQKVLYANGNKTIKNTKLKNTKYYLIIHLVANNIDQTHDLCYFFC